MMRNRSPRNRRDLRLVATATGIALVALGLALALPAAASLRLQHTVSLSDLARIEAEIRTALQDERSAVHTTETSYEMARVVVDAAGIELRLSQEAEAQALLDLDTAQFEQRAAAQSGSATRVVAAGERLWRAEATEEQARLRVLWAEQQLALHEAEAIVASIEIDRARAALELARVTLLLEHDLEAGSVYALADFQQQQARIEGELAEQRARTDRLQQQADQARTRFDDRLVRVH